MKRNVVRAMAIVLAAVLIFGLVATMLVPYA